MDTTGVAGEAYEPSPEDEEAFRLELEALGDASCSDTESDSDDEGLLRRYQLNDESSSDEGDEEPSCSTEFSASLNNLRTIFKKREEKLHDYEDVLSTLSENIRDSTAKLKPPRSCQDEEGGGEDKENAAGPVGSAAKALEAGQGAELSKEIMEEAASRNEAARKFKLMEQERERQRDKQRLELEKKAEEERLQREEESRLEMARLEEESRARLEAIEESFKQAEMELAQEEEKERAEAERIEREAQKQMENLKALQEQEEQRNRERLRRLEMQREERVKVALSDLHDKQAARVIQRHYFSFRRKKTAAIRIQSSLRRKKAMVRAEELRRLRSAAVVIQKWARCLACKRLLDRNKKARDIQKHFRRSSATKLVKSLLKSVVAIQTFCRMWVQRTKYLRVTRSVVAIQSYYRMSVERESFRAQGRAAKVIAAAWRRHITAKKSSKDLMNKVAQVAREGSLKDMYNMTDFLTRTGQNSNCLMQQLQGGLSDRCKGLTHELFQAARESLKVFESGRIPKIPQVQGHVRSAADSLGMASTVSRFDRAHGLMSSLKGFLERSRSSTSVLKNASNAKDSGMAEDFAYAWSMERMRSEYERKCLQTIFWPQAYVMMSLRQESFMLSYNKMVEKRKVHPLTLNASHYPQLNQATKKNDLTEDMLSLNSPGIHLDEVKDLDLSLEGLTSMKQIRRCKNLRKLCLNSNSIASLDGIQGCSLLEELNMKGNVLSTVGELKNLSKMRSLHLDGNAISAVDFLGSMVNLQDFTADDNRIEDFVCASASKVGLKSLSLAGNRVKELGSIAEFALLRELNLSRNQIQAFDGIERCRQLRVLNLANNYIFALPRVEGMNALENLTELRLSKNRLTSFPFACLSLPKLRALHLDENGIKEVEPVLGCPLLEKLELAFNQVSDVESIFALSSCQRLKSLNLCENPIAENRDFDVVVRRILPSLLELNNESVVGEGEVKTKCTFHAGTSLLKWNCIQRLKPELLHNSPGHLLSARDQMQCYLSDHTLAATHLPVVASVADIQRKQKGTWMSAINAQWKENTLNACRLVDVDVDCKDVSRHQRIHTEDAQFYSRRRVIFSEKAVFIQRFWRRFAKARREYRESSQGRQRAAQTIQRGFRTLRLKRSSEYIHAKEELRRLKEEKALEESLTRRKAAQRIQASWRGFRVRSYMAKAREQSKYVEDDDFELEDFDDDFLKDFDAEADKFLSSVITPSRGVSETPAGYGIQDPGSSSVSYRPSPAAYHEVPEIVEEEGSADRTPVPSSSNSPYVTNSPAQQTSGKRGIFKPPVLSQQTSSSFSPSPSKLHASESTLSVHEEKQKAKMEKIANEWGFKDQATAALFMKKRNKMVKQQKKRKKQEKLRDPSVRYQKFKESSSRHEPITRSPNTHHRNGKALSLAKTRIQALPSREGARGSLERESSRAQPSAENSRARVGQRPLPNEQDDVSVSTISMGSDEVHGTPSMDPHRIALEYLRGDGSSIQAHGTMVNNWSL
ncbi:hypothetical protein HOP50_12g65940 [Chloropicon primus]|nr:hypothetical protein HOP50_12g65940 [Chloropicon primus]